MSTQNFKYENVLITIPDFKFDNRCMDEECPHYEEEGNHCEHVSDHYDYDTEAYEIYVQEVQEQLKKIGFEDCDSFKNDRNYGGKIISSYCLLDKNDDVYKAVEVVIRNGYYHGANIDYTIEDSTESIYGSNDNTKIKTLDKKFDAKIVKLEKILQKNGTELTRVGVFSNGEAVYKLKK